MHAFSKFTYFPTELCACFQIIMRIVGILPFIIAAQTGGVHRDLLVDKSY